MLKKMSPIYLFIPFLTILLVTYYIIPRYPGCANSLSCIEDLSGTATRLKEGVFMDKKIILPAYLGDTNFAPSVLGEASGLPKHIFVDLTAQRLLAYEGGNLMYDFPVSSGKWNATPTGDFTIWIKLRYTLMTGGNSALGTYYYLPNVPYTMYFYNEAVPKSRGFGVHGAYWHNNFGHPMSHGCINLSTSDAEKLYLWAEPQSYQNVTYASAETPGTPITIYGQAPKE